MTNEEIIEEVKDTDEGKKEKKSKKDNKYLKEIEELKEENKSLKEKNMRVTAEMVNTIRRKDEELSRMLKYASENMILEILEVIDNFERAFNIECTDTNFIDGMKMIYNSLKNTLIKNEVIEIEALYNEFDPSMHQAVIQGEDSSKKSNIVIEVLQKGYTYKDKVIRPAMVKVNK